MSGRTSPRQHEPQHDEEPLSRKGETDPLLEVPRTRVNMPSRGVRSVVLAAQSGTL